jgi:hypothetical protein
VVAASPIRATSLSSKNTVALPARAYCSSGAPSLEPSCSAARPPSIAFC